MPDRPTARVQLCGGVVVDIVGRRVDATLGGRQCRILFAFLTLHRKRPVRRGELVEALWPGEAPADPAGVLNTLLSRLRRALGPDLVSGRAELRLALPEDAEVDIEVAFAAVQRAEQALERGSWSAVTAAADVALAIVEAEFVPEATAPWVFEERRRLEEIGLRALECLAAGGLGHGGPQLSITERAARMLIDRAPYRETGHGFLMRALGERGRIAEALRVFDDFRVLVHEELGSPPGAELRALHERLISRQELAPESERADPLTVCAASGGVLVTDVVDADDDQRAHHARLLRAASAAHGGRLLGPSGDRMVAVFRSTVDAASCAVELQQRAAQHNRRNPERGLAVRVALTAEPVISATTQVGSTSASMAQQLCDQARSGQILAEPPVLASVAASETHDFRRRDGGASLELVWDAPTERPFPLQRVVSSTGGAFVGRVPDLARLEEVYRRAATTRRLALIAGEPGIGKTRLAIEFASRAHADGAIVLYGRCDAEPLMAHQPFVEALRHYAAVCPLPELRGQLGPSSGELRRVLPELAERVSDLPELMAGDPDGARFRLFEAVSSLLCEAAQARPLVLVLDDLHWADAPTLLLLKYLMRYPRDASLLVLGTFRPTDLDRGDPSGASIAELYREHAVERHELAPLDIEAVGQLVAARAASGGSGALARAIYDRTEGNPFFVVEMLRHFAETGGDPAAAGDVGIPQGARDVIERRVARLGQHGERVLRIAAVTGRAFELDVLERVSDLEEDELLDALEQAVRVRLIEESGDAADRYAFAHALIRDTIYTSLGASRRARLHRHVATALEEAHVDDLEEYLGDLAHHFVRAGAEADIRRAIEYGTRAGERAISMLAYEQAAAYFRQAASLVDDTDRQRAAQRCSLLISQGEAERQAADASYRETLTNAAAIAQELGDVDLLARAALTNTRGSIFSSAQGVDGERVRVLEVALETQPTGDSSTRAMLLAHLAMELLPGPRWRDREVLADLALAMARRIGDPTTLGNVLNRRCNTILGPRVTHERRAHTAEAARLADALADPIIASEAAIIGAGAALEAGDLVDAARQHERYIDLTAQLGIPFMRWYERSWRVKHCLIAGDPRRAEQLAFETLTVGQEVGQPDALAWFLSQIGVARALQGSLDSGEPNLPDLFALPVSLPVGPELTPSHSVWLQVEAGKSATFCTVGRMEEGRRHFEAVMANDLEDLPRDYAELWIPAQASAACVLLGDRARAARLRALMEPHADSFVDNGPAWCGAASHYLGLLSAVLLELDDADALLAAAADAYARLPAPAWLMRVEIERAETLQMRSRTGDAARAGRLLRHAMGAAQAFGLPRIQSQIGALQG